MKTPFEEIKEKISNFTPENLADLLPKKWEKIGDVLVLKLKKELEPFAEIIAKTYAEVLNCKSVLQEIGGIKGIYREPRVRLIYGSKNTETLHVENGIKYSLDPSKLMFSSGNMSERIRMSKLNCRDEVVVDMFAGVGYFSLPIAVYCSPRMVYAIEKNPLAFRYLCKNITLNRVNDRVEPILGDNRCVTPKGVANRVIMGYLNKTYEFLPIALESLKSKGIIHFHCLCPRDKFPDYVMDKIRRYLSEKEFEVVYKKVVKSYAPGIDHVVLDIKVE